MFFNLDTGEVSGQAEENTRQCWRADENIFFEFSGVLCSVVMTNFMVLRVCQFLEHATTTDQYVEMQATRPTLIALEEECVGSRNFCIYDQYVQLIFNLNVSVLPKLAAFLRQQTQ